MRIRKPYVILGAGSILATGALYFALLAPSIELTESHKQDTEDFAAQIAEDQKKIAPLKEKLRAISPQLKTLEDLSDRTPSDMRINEMYDMIKSAAEISGLGKDGLIRHTYGSPQMVQLKQAVDEKGQNIGTQPPMVAKFPVTVSIRGSLGEIQSFYKELATLPRLNSLQNTRTSTGDGEVYSAEVTAYFYLQAIQIDRLAANLENVIRTALPKEEWPEGLEQKLAEQAEQAKAEREAQEEKASKDAEGVEKEP